MIYNEEEFEFTIYDIDPFNKNGTMWYVTAFYDYEFNYIKSIFKENTDFTIIETWEMHLGCNVLISSKVHMWLSLKFGPPSLMDSTTRKNLQDYGFIK